MEIKEKIYEFKGYIIMGCMAFGALSIWGKLPNPLFFLGDYTSIFYISLFGLGAYTYYEFHWGKAPAQHNLSRKLPPRNLSDKTHLKNLQAQRGPTAPQRRPPVSSESVRDKRQPSHKIFDTFNKD